MAEGVAGDYEASPLASYYEGFQPRTVSEVVFGPTSRVSPLDRLVAWKISRLWTARLGKLPAMPPVRRPGVQTVSDHVGPIRQHYGQVKIEKLRRLIESISETGYRPHEFSGGVTEGIFLVADERSAAHEFIFIPTEGQHRLGVLSALGHERIPVRPRPSGPTVRVSQLDRWARAWGLAPRDPLPRRVFDFYFDSDGSRQAELWGLR